MIIFNLNLGCTGWCVLVSLDTESYKVTHQGYLLSSSTFIVCIFNESVPRPIQSIFHNVRGYKN